VVRRIAKMLSGSRRSGVGGRRKKIDAYFSVARRIDSRSLRSKLAGEVRSILKLAGAARTAWIWLVTVGFDPSHEEWLDVSQ